MRRITGLALVVATVVVSSVPARGQQGSDASVEIRNNFFSPSEVHVAVGGSVTWSTVEGTHSVTADDGTFDSSPGCSGPLFLACLSAGDTFEHRFQSPGTVT